MGLSDFIIVPPVVDLVDCVPIVDEVDARLDPAMPELLVAQGFFSRLRVRRLGLPFTRLLVSYRLHSLDVVLCARVGHRDTGEMTDLRMQDSLSWYTLDGTKAQGVRLLVHCMHDLFRRFVVHEVDEAFFYDGVRVFDPHA